MKDIADLIVLAFFQKTMKVHPLLSRIWFPSLQNFSKCLLTFQLNPHQLSRKKCSWFCVCPQSKLQWQDKTSKPSSPRKCLWISRFNLDLALRLKPASVSYISRYIKQYSRFWEVTWWPESFCKKKRRTLVQPWSFTTNLDSWLRTVLVWKLRTAPWVTFKVLQKQRRENLLVECFLRTSGRIGKMTRWWLLYGVW